MTEQFEGRHIVKRDGSIKPFDAEKIVAAVVRAGKGTASSSMSSGS